MVEAVSNSLDKECRQLLEEWIAKLEQDPDPQIAGRGVVGRRELERQWIEAKEQYAASPEITRELLSRLEELSQRWEDYQSSAAAGEE